MSPPRKKDLAAGGRGYGYDPSDADFLKIERSPWEASASGIGRNAKFSDDDGHRKGSNWQDSDSHGLVNRYPDELSEGPHEKLAGLIDDSQPYDPLVPGGAPLTHGKDVGDGKPRFAPKNTKPYRTNSRG